MKTRIIFILCVCVLSGSFLLAQADIDVPEKQIPLVTKISASWCPNCGSWGWDLMEGLMEDNQLVSNLFTVHYSGDYRTDAGASMTSNFGAIGQPDFFLNSERISVSSSNSASKRSEIKEAIAQKAGSQPLAQTGLLAGTYEGQLNILTRTKFFQASEGEYFLSLYLLENIFVGQQAGRGSEAQHKNLLRMSLTEQVFGAPIADGGIEAGKESLFSLSIPVSDIPYEIDNISILSVIWKKGDNKFEVVNSNSTLDIINGLELTPTRTSDLKKGDFSVSVQPNVVSDVAKVELILPSQRNQFRVELWTLDGRKLQDVFAGKLGAGKHSWMIDRSSFNSAGLYILRLHDGAGQISKRIIVR